ncbi:TPA: hypothetical protein EYP44_05045 [Candidatus Bathyarchaeota archaeon]|nr:hypothetical protein [Candidatus Bathyarchaeota archaeon]
MDRIRVGVVGTGGIFQLAHLPAYPDVGGQLVALCDISPDALRAAGRGVRAVYTERARKSEEGGRSWPSA